MSKNGNSTSKSKSKSKSKSSGEEKMSEQVKVVMEDAGEILGAAEEWNEKAQDLANELADPLLHKLKQGLAPTHNGGACANISMHIPAFVHLHSLRALFP